MICHSALIELFSQIRREVRAEFGWRLLLSDSGSVNLLPAIKCQTRNPLTRVLIDEFLQEYSQQA